MTMTNKERKALARHKRIVKAKNITRSTKTKNEKRGIV